MIPRIFPHKTLALTLVLTLSLPHLALALRTEAGLESSVQSALLQSITAAGLEAEWQELTIDALDEILDRIDAGWQFKDGYQQDLEAKGPVNASGQFFLGLASMPSGVRVSMGYDIFEIARAGGWQYREPDFAAGLEALSHRADQPGVLVIGPELAAHSGLEALVRPAAFADRIVFYDIESDQARRLEAANPNVQIVQGGLEDLAIALMGIPAAEVVTVAGSPDLAVALEQLLPMPVRQLAGFTLRSILLALGVSQAGLEQVDISRIEAQFLGSAA